MSPVTQAADGPKPVLALQNACDLRSKWFGMLILVIAFSAAACWSPPASAQDLGTRPEYHAVLSPEWSLHSDAAAPKRPLYVVGIEKLSKNVATGVLFHRIESDPRRPCIAGNFNCLRLLAAPESIASAIRAFVTHDKVLWPTHVVQIRGDRKACVTVIHMHRRSSRKRMIASQTIDRSRSRRKAPISGT